MSQPQAFKSDDDELGPPPVRMPLGGAGVLLLLFLLLVGVYVGFRLLRGDGEGRYGAKHASVGKAPEQWRLEPLTGEPPAIDRAALEGKVTVVNFWGTWCPPCHEEFPHVVALWKELEADPDFQLAAVSCEPGIEKNIDRLRKVTTNFLEEQKTAMPTYYDPQGISRIATQDTTGEDLAFPATIIFGRDGTVRGYWKGYWPGMEQDIAKVTRRLLAEKK